ncbi:hypothetical protein ADIARSV_0004 [Arcticibacter svalbardensis MN12-7]|uniref:Uncharacterized protein n=2 Tax=Arcticibacter TaxID=1288026 RepID=R9GYC3_9SPHI|nr:hypothetical protein ADIARSV_0004 [Arcticibacter svalbardensis MN12-7]
MFQTQINDRAISDNKIARVSELVNRLNAASFFSMLQFNYQNRIIKSVLVYRIGHQELISENFRFYYFKLLRSRIVKKAFMRVIDNDEEPALVALDSTRF